MSGEMINLTSGQNIIFETDNLKRATPALVSRCSLIHFNTSIITYKCLIHNFLLNLDQELFDEDKIKGLKDMFEWLVPPVLDFLLRMDFKKLFLNVNQMHLMRGMLHLLKALFEPKSLSNTTTTNTTTMSTSGRTTNVEGASAQEPDVLHLQTSFIFALIWGLGSTLNNSGRKVFDHFIRGLINRNENKPQSFKLGRANLIPEGLTVFDYCLDPHKVATWMKWSDLTTSHYCSSSNMISTTETNRQLFFLELSIVHDNWPLMLLGPGATGKSFVTQHLLRKLSTERFLVNVIHFSAKTSQSYTQNVILGKLDRRRKGVFGPALGKRCVIFVDDLSLPQRDEALAMPPIELLRQILGHNHVYDSRDNSRLELIDVSLVVSANSLDAHQLSSRFVHMMNTLAIDSFETDTLQTIFATHVQGHYKEHGFDLAVLHLVPNIANASLRLFKDVQSAFRPVLQNFHYMFSVRDFCALMRALCLPSASVMRDTMKLVRLWCHEANRVFQDRLINEDHRKTFMELLQKHCKNELKIDLKQVLKTNNEKELRNQMEKVVFADLGQAGNKRIYDEVISLNRLKSIIEQWLKEYNTCHITKLNLVLFDESLHHVLRLYRLLNTTRHALLIGESGCGRSSVIRLASFMGGHELFEVKASKSYNELKWQEDLKFVLKRAGADCRRIVMVLKDSQIKQESFLEDLTMVLNTGEVPNLFLPEEKADIMERVLAKVDHAEHNLASLHNEFVDNVKRNLHLVLCFASNQEQFRNRLRQFPSLLHWCSVDFYSSWSSSSLYSVASSILSSAQFVDKATLELCVSCAIELHLHLINELDDLNIVTPATFIALIKTFKVLLKEQREEILRLKTRYEAGLDKLEFAASQVSAMQNELTLLRPQLLETSYETECLMIRIEQDTIQVEAKKEVVACDEALANEAAAAAQAIRDDCENDLAEAIPALQAAVSALDTLNPSDITVIKTMKSPAPIVRLVVEAVCVMKGIAPDRRPNAKGVLIDDYWPPAQKMMGDIKFLDSLKAFDKDNIEGEIVRKIRSDYLTNPLFQPDLVKHVSTACEGLCKWVRAIEIYDRVIKIVSPKKNKLNEAELELASQMDKLNEKRSQLQQVTDKLQSLNDEFAAMTKKKRDLEANIDLCSKKLERAEKLIQGLDTERTRWNTMARIMAHKLVNITGDVLIGAGVIVYLGSFDNDFRTSILQNWKESCKKLNLSCSEDFSLTNCFGDSVQIRQWQMNGLPSDAFSVDNAVIMSKTVKWPVLIDPQGQARKWLMATEPDLIVVKYNNDDYLSQIRENLNNGNPTLLDSINTHDDLDADLKPILALRERKIVDNENTGLISIGEVDTEVHADFKLYLMAGNNDLGKYRRQNRKSDTCLINFSMTQIGLQQQLLALLVSLERPELEETRNRLIGEHNRNEARLREIEEKILKVLSASQGNILEDETAIQVLSQSKVLAEEISRKQLDTKQTEEAIERTRDIYATVANHSAIIFLCIQQLTRINELYNFSLPWFINMYTQCIRSLAPDASDRIHALKQHITASILEVLSNALHPKDFEAFELNLVLSLITDKEQDNDNLKAANFIINHETIHYKNESRNAFNSWLSDYKWQRIMFLGQEMKIFQGLLHQMRRNEMNWYDFVHSKDLPGEEHLPEPFNDCSILPRLALLLALRPDSFAQSSRLFINQHLGVKTSSTSSLSFLYNQSDRLSPLLLMSDASNVSDAVRAWRTFCPDKLELRPKRRYVLSMGKGQEMSAEKLINKASENGGWLLVQNVHLCPHWLPRLATIWDEQVVNRAGRIHKAFRLWITTETCPSFPVALLQRGTNQIIKSCKLSLSSSTSSVSLSSLVLKSFNDLKSTSLLTSFPLEQHSWTNDYNFGLNDLIFAIDQLIKLANINKSDEFVLKGMANLMEESVYGGRISHGSDLNLINVLIEECFSNNVINENSKEEHRIMSNKPIISKQFDLNNIEDFIRQKVQKSEGNVQDLAELLGLHRSAAVLREERSVQKLLKSLAIMSSSRTKIIKSSESSSLEQTLERLLNKTLPPLLPIDTLQALLTTLNFSKETNSFLIEECQMLNKICLFVQNRLTILLNELRGLSPMSDDNEKDLTAIQTDMVPEEWSENTGLKPNLLSIFFADLINKMNGFKVWITDREDKAKLTIKWSALCRPRRLIMALRRQIAKERKMALHQVSLKMRCAPRIQSLDNTLVLSNLWLMGGAKLDLESSLFTVDPKLISCPMPNVSLIRVEENKCYFLCPIYEKASTRSDLVCHLFVEVVDEEVAKKLAMQGVAIALNST